MNHPKTISIALVVYKVQKIELQCDQQIQDQNQNLRKKSQDVRNQPKEFDPNDPTTWCNPMRDEQPKDTSITSIIQKLTKKSFDRPKYHVPAPKSSRDKCGVNEDDVFRHQVR